MLYPQPLKLRAAVHATCTLPSLADLGRMLSVIPLVRQCQTGNSSKPQTDRKWPGSMAKRADWDATAETCSRTINRAAGELLQRLGAMATAALAAQQKTSSASTSYNSSSSAITSLVTTGSVIRVVVDAKVKVTRLSGSRYVRACTSPYWPAPASK